MVENNKLIAEFMGLEIITDDISWFDKDFCALKKYNESWNWLMPVVEKIEGIPHGPSDPEADYRFEVEICNGYCDIFDWEITGSRTEIASSNRPGNKIWATHEAVVAFIKWYKNINNDLDTK